MGKVILEVRNLKTKYITRFHEDVYAVDGVSFTIEEGKSLGIAGESGCGKSTLALSMMGYYFPPLHYMSGEIIIDGKNISGMKPDDVRKTILGSEIAYIPQAAMNALNPTQKIIRFVEDVVRAHDPKADKKEIRKLAETRFAELGLPASVLDKHAVELSGGMKQRTVIAVSTILNPKVLIADEPSSALDVTSQKMVIKMMRQLMEKGYVKAMLFITHELPLLYNVTDDIMVMYAGQIVEKGSAKEMVFDPPLFPRPDEFHSGSRRGHPRPQAHRHPRHAPQPEEASRRLPLCRALQVCPSRVPLHRHSRAELRRRPYVPVPAGCGRTEGGLQP